MSASNEWLDDEDPNERDDNDELPTGSAATQFGNGQPRNTGGRPKGAKDRNATVRRVANKRMFITENDKQVRLSYIQILLRRIRNEAIKGNNGALNVADRIRKLYQEEGSQNTSGVLILPEPIESVEQWATLHHPDNAAEKMNSFKQLTNNYYDDLLAEDLSPSPTAHDDLDSALQKPKQSDVVAVPPARSLKLIRPSKANDPQSDR